MSLIDEIENQYNEIDKRYYALEFVAIGESNEEDENHYRIKRELNAHAYFLFLFTRLEDHIKTESEKLIINKISSLTDWKEKAIWEISDDKHLHFKKRLCLLTKKGEKDYNRIVEYYDIRNEIGHGKTIDDILKAINMPTVFEDVKKYFIKLKA